ncbi:cysteine hydrolase [Pseudoalteromonas citrea]|uniref:Cysteine hydrolase n=1 Tax=Pseudoalteromonas citrea TaxID=43655 RepID=A0A5S3XMT4_9GAMM|nr:isochorismatase family protein [Pseudoalteromonas citrea]TMP46564.1 cysteine hydrolase [Pseudoalteromonas citrea]TMP57585.1 cysteine hydrolase [Pseudoalteromonas citrea]
MNKALLVIDTQDSFFKTDYWQERDFESFKQNLAQLTQTFAQNKNPIVKILHAREDVEESPFNPQCGLVKPMAFLENKFDKTFYKSVHNAFTDTGLEMWLKRQQIKTLVITGIRTEQCCETTARIASDLGFNVEFVTDATLTFDMTCAISGNKYTAEDIKARTNLVLAQRFATIHSYADYQ